jgi:2-keto-4-pentenoate hydratase/2-oxohepta-3-ene-1,7-dioic acid hydratase in catechol pathway
VFGYGICLDMTRRTPARHAGRPEAIPWELKKSFDHSSPPCGPVYPVEQVGHPASGGNIRLEVDGVAKPGFRPQPDDLAHAGDHRDAVALLSRWSRAT